MKIEQLTHHQHIDSEERFPIVVLLDKLTDPVNIGSLFRLSDAFGIEEILIEGDIFPPNKKISKSSRSCDKIIPYRIFDSTEEAIGYLKSNKYAIIAIEITNTSKDLSSFDFTKFNSICFIVGSEKNGVSQEYLDISDEICHIKMRGNNSSMNVAMAFGITIYEATKQM